MCCCGHSSVSNVAKMVCWRFFPGFANTMAEFKAQDLGSLADGESSIKGTWDTAGFRVERSLEKQMTAGLEEPLKL